MEVKLPEQIMSNPLVWIGLTMVGSLLKELVVATLRGIAKKWKSDKNPNNDTLAEGIEAAADAVDKLPGLAAKKK